jgi:hypothetical protein
MSDIKQSCIQCGATFTDAENKEGECAFHVAPYDSWSRKRACCDGKVPCQRKAHTAKHHCNYAYEALFARARDILGYTDTVEQWGECEASDLDTNKEITVTVGQLLRWKSRAAYIGESTPLLLVRVGTVWPNNPFFFRTFDALELDAVGQAAGSASVVPVYRTTPESTAYGSFAWLVEKQIVVGARLEAKSATDERPTVVEVRFSVLPLAKQSSVVVQRGGIVEKRVPTPHALPDVTCNAATPLDLDVVQAHMPAKARDDFRTRDAVSRKKHLSLQLGTPLKCNENSVSNGRDRFDFHLQVINTGSEPFMFLKLAAEFKLLNDDAWQPVEEFDWGRYQPAAPLPLTAHPLGTVDITGIVVVPFRDAADAQRRPWFYRSFLARHRPLRLRFTLTDAAGRELTRVFEYVTKVGKLEQRRDSDTLFLALDDANELDRVYCRVQAKPDGDTLAELDGTSFDVKTARQIVHKAKTTGKSEIALDKFDKDKDDYTVRFWALVDRAADAVYAIKAQIVLKRTNVGRQAYCPIRFYGPDDAEQIPVGVAAVEDAQLPATFTNEPSPFVFADAGLDELTDADVDFPAEPAAAAPAAGGGGGTVSIDLSRIEAKLDTLNATMERIAAALERVLQK